MREWGDVMADLSGKIALVIGAAGKDNMGQVIIRRLKQDGAHVIAAGRHEEALAALAAETGGDWVKCDITKKEDITAMAGKIAADHGKLHIAVNATGWGLLTPFLDTTEDELRRMTDLQFIGPYMFFQAMIELMSEGGSLIQISSATAKIMLNDHAAYMGTKAGFDHVMRCIAHEFGDRGIRSNTISPGLTDTPMTAGAKATPGIFESFLDSYPLGRIGTSEDIAAAVSWVSSDECFMTGETFQVNGGLCLRRNPTAAEMIASAAAHANKS